MTTAAPITVTAIKVLERASDETLCFEATVRWHGKPFATATNEGKGGNTMIRATPTGRYAEAEAEAWCRANLPVEVLDLKTQRFVEVTGEEAATIRAAIIAHNAARAEAWRKASTEGAPLVWPEEPANLKRYILRTLEDYVDHLVYAWHNAKIAAAEEAALRKQCATKTIYNRAEQQWEIARPFSTAIRDHLTAKYPGEEIEFVNLRFDTLENYDAKAAELAAAREEARLRDLCKTKTLYVLNGKTWVVARPFSPAVEQDIQARHPGAEFINPRFAK